MLKPSPYWRWERLLKYHTDNRKGEKVSTNMNMKVPHTYQLEVFVQVRTQITCKGTIKVNSYSCD